MQAARPAGMLPRTASREVKARPPQPPPFLRGPSALHSPRELVINSPRGPGRPGRQENCFQAICGKTGICKPEGQWTFVGEGKGNYDKVKRYEFVGEGGDFDVKDGDASRADCGSMRCGSVCLCLAALAAGVYIAGRVLGEAVPHAPYNCMEQDALKRAAWEPTRLEWCCAHAGVDCAGPAARAALRDAAQAAPTAAAPAQTAAAPSPPPLFSGVPVATQAPPQAPASTARQGMFVDAPPGAEAPVVRQTAFVDAPPGMQQAQVATAALPVSTAVRSAPAAPAAPVPEAALPVSTALRPALAGPTAPVASGSEAPRQCDTDGVVLTQDPRRWTPPLWKYSQESGICTPLEVAAAAWEALSFQSEAECMAACGGQQARQ